MDNLCSEALCKFIHSSSGCSLWGKRLRKLLAVGQTEWGGARGSLDILGDLEETVVGRPGGSPTLSQWSPDLAAIGRAIKTPMPTLDTVWIRSECLEVNTRNREFLKIPADSNMQPNLGTTGLGTALLCSNLPPFSLKVSSELI